MSDPQLVIGLNAVLTALDGERPCVLCVDRTGGLALPFGSFDPRRHRTFELGLRQFVERQAAVPLGYVEQLYTFGDEGRESPRARMKDSLATDRIVSVGYLGLAPEAAKPAIARAAWYDWYALFPWEDWRRGEPRVLQARIAPALQAWAGSTDRKDRVRACFGTGNIGWEEERVLDRYELLYEAGLVPEAARDLGQDARPDAAALDARPMISDHRRILATAMGRLRGKLRYRPVVFQMMPERFTLSDMQGAVEAILGFSIHKQNFRRSVEGSGLIEKTEDRVAATGGRPAALFRTSALAKAKHAPGLNLPRLRA